MHFRPGASEGSFEFLSKQKIDAKFKGPDQISHYFEIIKFTVGIFWKLVTYAFSNLYDIV